MADSRLRPRVARSRRAQFPRSSRGSLCFAPSLRICTRSIVLDSRRSRAEEHEATTGRSAVLAVIAADRTILSLPGLPRTGGQPIPGTSSPPSFSRHPGRWDRTALRSLTRPASSRCPNLDSRKAARLLLKKNSGCSSAWMVFNPGEERASVQMFHDLPSGVSSSSPGVSLRLDTFSESRSARSRSFGSPGASSLFGFGSK